jgi:hypothetical protein
MKYFVSYAIAGVPKGPVAIDDNLSLEEALSLAGELIAEGSQDKSCRRFSAVSPRRLTHFPG